MKILAQSKERTWYLVKEWTTRAGLPARIHMCKWVERVSLPPHYTGYVQLPEGHAKRYYDSDTDVHGGVTFEGKMKGVAGVWTGFDMAHFGDDRIKNPENYAEDECERLAKIIKST